MSNVVTVQCISVTHTYLVLHMAEKAKFQYNKQAEYPTYHFSHMDSVSVLPWDIFHTIRYDRPSHRCDSYSSAAYHKAAKLKTEIFENENFIEVYALLHVKNLQVTLVFSFLHINTDDSGHHKVQTMLTWKSNVRLNFFAFFMMY